MWCDVKSVEGRKEEKVREIKWKGHSAICGREKRSRKSQHWWQCSLEELCEWEQVKEERNRESMRKLWEIHGEKESSEWKEKESFFFTQIVSLSVVISI